MSEYDWITPMRKNTNGTDEDRAARMEDRLFGQAAMRVLDGDRVQISVMPDAGCFDTAVIISMDDARRLANAILVHTPRYPEGTPEYAAYAEELGTELTKWRSHEGEYTDGQ